MANVDSVDITVRGKGAMAVASTNHRPHRRGLSCSTCKRCSREIDPQEPAVVTVGSIHGGSKHNIIPRKCICRSRSVQFQG
jgi:hippurate hydrolase